MKLKRLFENKYGTFGKLTLITGHELYTIEKQYHSNKRFISCVPPGKYRLIPHDSRKHGKVVALVNPDLCVHHYRRQNGRYGILFHAANLAEQLEGCIAPGMDYGVVRQSWGVVKSSEAMGLLMKSFENDEELIIERA